MYFDLPLMRQRSPAYVPLRPSSSDSDRSFPKFYLDTPSYTPSSEHLRENLNRSPSRWGPLQYIPVSGSEFYVAVSPRRPLYKLLRGLLWTAILLPIVLGFLVIFTTAFRPSYTHAPSHYNELRERAVQSTEPGRGNIHNEKVFIAASLYDANGTLVGGSWSQNILDLVDLLGPENVHLSIYENDPDDLAKDALESFKSRVKCNSTLVAEHLPLEDIRRVPLPNGEKRIKRIAYLAETRNRALRPLDDIETKFDKLLFLNDVYFNPIDAAQLLFSTNLDSNGKTDYRAACAVDFINPFKFYDTFATRDLEGHSMSLPFFPWFPNAGLADTRSDVVNQKDAVRVRSCWGGMVAYEARWFQSTPDLTNADPVEGTAWGAAFASGRTELSGIPTNTSTLRFRFEDRTYWEASECCLINADIQKPRDPANPHAPSGIFMNPYVRTAYDEYTLLWLPLTRRPERLYSLIHDILNRIVGLPGNNPRRTQEPGDLVMERVWQQDAAASNTTEPIGSWKEVERIAGPGSFCGSRKLLVLGEKEGESKWMHFAAPPEDV
ncbi:glycosyltransferase family 69 protein [Aplosporella prunicola CBS 121167]|uniref:Glycosyltransferase family 69 protein n=1 Tax=Aplosporella prunicola CBS 121167 TaxID=1176127 RepID=A0A6A6BMR4_9PEZI|nr:glycosyltransferase family 69 protein [Aplosporella prunicola CBS 121167]KAF2144117.1 glycosyltransferase family 69 protein [Aplosporella prunicola CBS 121167]